MLHGEKAKARIREKICYLYYLTVEIAKMLEVHKYTRFSAMYMRSIVSFFFFKVLFMRERASAHPSKWGKGWKWRERERISS